MNTTSSSLLNTLSGWSRTILYLAITAFHAWYLFGFLPLSGLIFLSFIGGLLLYFGLKKFSGSFTNFPIKVVPIFSGTILLALGTLTLIPGWPDYLLLKTPIGWPVLEERTRLLGKALYNKDISLVRKIAWIGIGDPAPRDTFGHPLIYDAKNPDMLKILLDSGLDPDARDEDTTTLLMRTNDENIASVLLAAGANPNARDENGRTPLMYVHNANVKLIKLLADNGAQINDVDDHGRTVADWLGNSPQIEDLLGQYSAGNVHRSDELDFLGHARLDWLEQKTLGSTLPTRPSAISISPTPLSYGDLAEITIRLSNESDTDRVVKVEANLNSEALFIQTSHDGRIVNPYQPQLDQEIVWPMLALPAHNSGLLTMTIITRDVWDGGDLSIDVKARNVLTYADEETIYLNLYQSLSGNQSDAQSTGSLLRSLLGALLFPLPVFILIGTWRFLGLQHPVTRVTLRLVTGMFSVLFALITYSSVADAVRQYTVFEEVEARILDQRFYLKSVTSTGSGNQRSSTTIHRMPIVAVQYKTIQEDIISTGPASFQFFRDYKLGAFAPIWYDPEHPKTFVITRNVSIFSIIGIGIAATICLVLAFITFKAGFIFRLSLQK